MRMETKPISQPIEVNRTTESYLVSRSRQLELQGWWLDREADLDGSVNSWRARWVEQVAVLTVRKAD